MKFVALAMYLIIDDKTMITTPLISIMEQKQYLAMQRCVHG